MRISLLAGELKQMHLSSRGALLNGAASVRLFQLIASVLTLLFTTSSIVSFQPLCNEPPAVMRVSLPKTFSRLLIVGHNRNVAAEPTAIAHSGC